MMFGNWTSKWRAGKSTVRFNGIRVIYDWRPKLVNSVSARANERSDGQRRRRHNLLAEDLRRTGSPLALPRSHKTIQHFRVLACCPVPRKVLSHGVLPKLNDIPGTIEPRRNGPADRVIQRRRRGIVELEAGPDAGGLSSYVSTVSSSPPTARTMGRLP